MRSMMSVGFRRAGLRPVMSGDDGEISSMIDDLGNTTPLRLLNV